MEDVFVLSAVRTPIGKYGGGLASVPPCDLAAMVVREAVSRSGVTRSTSVTWCSATCSTPRPGTCTWPGSRRSTAASKIGTPAMTLNRLCGSGMQAIVSAAQAIMLGDCEVAVAGGVESMSRAPYWLSGMRWGQRMGDGVAHRLRDRRAHRSVRRLPHGRDRGERGRGLRRFPGRPGRAGRGEPPPGRRRDRGRLLQGADPPGRDPRQEGQGHRRRHRRAHPAGRQPGGHGQAAARVREGRHGHRGQRVRPQRRRRGRGARLRRRSSAAAA